MGTIFNRKKLYQEITQKIIDLLKQGKVIWHQEWAGSSFPTNFFTKKRYRGVNAILLWVAQLKSNYRSPYWLTFKQIQKLKGKLKKGSRGVHVYFYEKYQPTSIKKICKNCKKLDKCQEGQLWIVAENDISIAEDANVNDICENYEAIYYSIIKSYVVFNLDCIEGIKVKSNVCQKWLADYSGIKKILGSYVDAPPVIEKGSRAYYNPVEDYICMPPKSKFYEEEGYWATLFHELIHSTGNEKRLNRKSLYERTEHSYSLEELIAELGVCFLCAETGIINKKRVENSTGYIKNWIEVLENNTAWIWKAAHEAEKACKYILNSSVQPKSHQKAA